MPVGVAVASEDAIEAVIDGKLVTMLAKVGRILMMVALEPASMGAKLGSSRGGTTTGALRMSSGVMSGTTAPAGIVELFLPSPPAGDADTPMT